MEREAATDKASRAERDEFPDSAGLRLLELAPDAIIGIGSDGHIRFASSQVEPVFGYTPDELYGRPIEVLVPERYRGAHVSHRGRYFEAPRMRPMGAGLELYALRKDGSEFPCEISLSATTQEGRLAALAAVRDVTERKRAEEELQRANAELERAGRAKDSFLASMSHELRTPLNAILGFTGTLLMELPGELNDEQRSQLQTVQTNGRHLLSLINDLLDVAKIESGKVEVNPERFACADVIAEVTAALQPMAEEKNLSFEVELPDPSPSVHSDRRALSQILINLLNNAIKFTDSGGVRLDVTRDPATKLVSFAVSDTGPGIAAEDQDRLFEAFEQTREAVSHPGGTGLGLYICRELAGLIGGELSLESAPGRGSTFTLEVRDA